MENGSPNSAPKPPRTVGHGGLTRKVRARGEGEHACVPTEDGLGTALSGEEGARETLRGLFLEVLESLSHLTIRIQARLSHRRRVTSDSEQTPK